MSAARRQRRGYVETLLRMAGLLHDVDFDVTAESPERHGALGADLLADRLPAEAVQAIRALRERTTDVVSLQEIHADPRPAVDAPAPSK